MPRETTLTLAAAQVVAKGCPLGFSLTFSYLTKDGQVCGFSHVGARDCWWIRTGIASSFLILFPASPFLTLHLADDPWGEKVLGTSPGAMPGLPPARKEASVQKFSEMAGQLAEGGVLATWPRVSLVKGVCPAHCGTLCGTSGLLPRKHGAGGTVPSRLLSYMATCALPCKLSPLENCRREGATSGTHSLTLSLMP